MDVTRPCSRWSRRISNRSRSASMNPSHSSRSRYRQNAPTTREMSPSYTASATRGFDFARHRGQHLTWKRRAPCQGRPITGPPRCPAIPAVRSDRSEDRPCLCLSRWRTHRDGDAHWHSSEPIAPRRTPPLRTHRMRLLGSELGLARPGSRLIAPHVASGKGASKFSRKRSQHGGLVRAWLPYRRAGVPPWSCVDSAPPTGQLPEHCGDAPDPSAVELTDIPHL